MTDMDTGSAGAAAPGAGGETASNDGKISGAQTQQSAQGAAQEDEFEEIKIGSVGAKVPKAIAAQIKNLERGFHFKSQELVRERQERARDRQQNAQLEQMVKANPKAFLQKFGIDPFEFSEMTLAEKLEALQMSPEQKRLKELEARNKHWEDQERRRQEDDKRQKLSALEAEQKETLDKEIADAWKSSELPADPFYVKQIAAVMRDSYQLARSGQIEKPLTAAQSASIVKQRFDNFMTSLMGKMDPQGILRLMGDKKFSELREWDLKRVTEKAPASLSGSMQRPGSQPASAETEKPNKPLNEREYRKYWLDAAK